MILKFSYLLYNTVSLPAPTSMWQTSWPIIHPYKMSDNFMTSQGTDNLYYTI